MPFNANRWRYLAVGLLGVGSGFTLGTQWVPRASFLASRSAFAPLAASNLEPEDTYVNAVQFGLDLQRLPCVDTLLAREPFYRRTIRILWADSTGVEALAIPPPGHSAPYYLIRGDSITHLQLSRRRAHF